MITIKNREKISAKIEKAYNDGHKSMMMKLKTEPKFLLLLGILTNCLLKVQKVN